jgi:alpha-tubulin suppressor-like RCC1 family protein
MPLTAAIAQRTPRRRAAPAPAGIRTTWIAVSAGGSFTCALDQTGQAYCWGENVNHKLGLGDSANVRTPRAVETPTRFTSITTGAMDACGVTRDGSAVCWGGAEGTGSMPRSAFGELRWRAMDLAGGGCGIAMDSTAYCWGPNRMGQLGSGRTTPGPSVGAEKVASPLHWKAIAAASNYRCALTGAGQAYCWGGPVAGGRPTPTPVPGNLVFQSLTAGENHVCGITQAGTAYCWGEAHDGSLGTAQNQRTMQPVAVTGTRTWKALSAGYDFTCGIASDNRAWCWGRNDYGAVGGGNLRHNIVPVPVAGTQTFTAISAGASHVCAIATDGSLWCWGDNADGGLGIARSQACRRTLGPGQVDVHPCAMAPTKVETPR